MFTACFRKKYCYVFGGFLVQKSYLYTIKNMSFTYEYNDENKVENFRISPRKSSAVVWHPRESSEIFGSIRESSVLFGNLQNNRELSEMAENSLILNKIILTFFGAVFVSFWKKLTVTVNFLLLVLKCLKCNYSMSTSSPGRFSLALEVGPPHLQSQGKAPWGRFDVKDKKK